MNRGRVLIIEDSRFLRTAFEKVIARSGYEVLLAADGEEGLGVALEAQPDVIVLDWIMPRMQGAEVLARLKQDARTSGIPVIVVSGVEKETKIDLVTAAGAALFLDKNTLSVSELAQHITRLRPSVLTVQ